ncbi:uncharacterized protein LOC142345997 [Convolutriloba macropyga]|uniref:uncharacterized protein LOC142345997 n=1 Tax=Convolutriloba macropyga TaxID=536237 RepID=UPI003F527D5F
MAENTSDDESLWEATKKHWEFFKHKAKEVGTTIQTETQKFSDEVNKFVLTPTKRDDDNNQSNTADDQSTHETQLAIPKFLPKYSSTDPKVITKALVFHLKRERVLKQLNMFRLGTKELKPHVFSDICPEERAEKFKLMRRTSQPLFIIEKMKTTEQRDKELQMRKLSRRGTLLKMALKETPTEPEKEKKFLIF